MEDFSSKCVREKGGVVCLAERGGDGVDDVAEHLLEAGQVVRHRPQLPVQHGALHTVARSKSSAEPRCSRDRLHLHNLSELLSHHEAHCSIGEAHRQVGQPGHCLPSLVSLTNKSFDAAGISRALSFAQSEMLSITRAWVSSPTRRASRDGSCALTTATSSSSMRPTLRRRPSMGWW